MTSHLRNSHLIHNYLSIHSKKTKEEKIEETKQN